MGSRQGKREQLPFHATHVCLSLGPALAGSLPFLAWDQQELCGDPATVRGGVVVAGSGTWGLLEESFGLRNSHHRELLRVTLGPGPGQTPPVGAGPES